MICLPDLDSRMVNPRPTFGIGGSGLPFALESSLPLPAPRGPRILCLEREAFAPVFRVFAIALLLTVILHTMPQANSPVP